MSKSYSVIGASLTTLDVLSMIAGAMKAVDGKEVATELKIPYGTAMCHIETLARAGYVERFGDGYMSTLKPSILFIRKKGIHEFFYEIDSIPFLSKYRTIEASIKTLRVLDEVARIGAGSISGADVSYETGINYNSTMCHLATLERAGYIEQLADGRFTASLKLGTFYAKKVAQLEFARKEITKNLSRIGAE
jgi:DNA-binding IclR family transcriptional regulator